MDSEQEREGYLLVDLIGKLVTLAGHTYLPRDWMIHWIKIDKKCNWPGLEEWHLKFDVGKEWKLEAGVKEVAGRKALQRER